MYFRIVAAALFLSPLFAASSETSARAVEREQVDRLAAPYLENDIVVGMSIGIIADGKRQSFGYGRTAAKSKQRPDGATLYEIGSITKVFTGILLADAAGRKEVKLEQPIQELLPDDVKLAVKDQPIQLSHLSTHTSGVPRLPNNMKPADPKNPYADYSVEQMYEFLRKHQPRRAPDGKIEYSNLAVGMLGHLLARRAEVSYEQLLQNRVTQPLKMDSTAIELSPALNERLAAPHLADGQPAANWDLPTLAGAGAIRSSVDDMLLFAAAQLDPPEGPLGEAINLAWKVHVKPKQDSDFAMGLGWHVARDGQTRWHTGATGGYHSMILVNRPLKVAVVVLSNTSTGEVERLAEDLVRMLAGATVEPREFDKRKEVAVSQEVIDRYVGSYALAPTFVLTVTREDNELHVQATGQQKIRVFPKSETRWFYKVVDAQITFNVNDEGKCESLTLHQNGRDLKARRSGD